MNKVSDKIINDALQEAEKIKDLSLQEFNELKKIHKTHKEKLEINYNQKIEKFKEIEYSKLISKIDLENRTKKLLRKREILNNLKTELSKKIKNENELYIHFLKSTLIKIIETGNEEILIPENDKNIYTNSFFKEIQEKHNKKISPNFNIKFEKLENGLIIKNDLFEFKANIDNAINYIFYEFEIDIAKILFENL